MIGIIDVGSGNIRSVKKAINYCQYPCEVVQNRKEMQNVDALILPGVGNFGQVALKIRKFQLEQALKDQIGEGKPFLGICVGFQLLFGSSQESPDIEGFNLLPGQVVQFNHPKIPQIGWNYVKPNSDSTPNPTTNERQKMALDPRYQDLFQSGYAYFVNSYYVESGIEIPNSCYAQYGINFLAGIQYKNIVAVQFHPEKSSKYGVEFLQRWISCWQKE